MEKEISIKKVAISHGMFLKVSYTEHLPNSDERSHSGVSCSAPVHQDLAAAFKEFTAHLALVCEEITNNEFIDSIPENERSDDMVMEFGELVPAIKVARSRKSAPIIPNLNGSEEKEDNIMDRFDLTSVEFKMSGGVEAIILTGKKELSTKKWMGLGPAPDIKENDSEYKFTSDLLQLSELLKHEVKQYIINHKYAPAAQPELFGNGVGIEEEQY